MTKEPVKIGENYYIVGVKSREEANMEEFAKQRDTLTEQMLTRKRSELFSEYLAATRRKMDEAGQIRIYEDAVAKVDAVDATTPAPPQMPLNFPTN